MAEIQGWLKERYDARSAAFGCTREPPYLGSFLMTHRGYSIEITIMELTDD